MSNEAKHASGPWALGDDGADVISNDGMCIARVMRASDFANLPRATDDRRERADARCLSNAALIIAAPKLLAALLAMLNHSCVADIAAVDKYAEDHAAERLARAAIAEATGAAP